MARNYQGGEPTPSNSMEITDKPKIPQIVNEQGEPMEVQAIRSRLSDMRRDLENAADTCIGKINEATELTRSEELRNCNERVKILKNALKDNHKKEIADLKKDYQDRLARANIKYETLLLRKVEDLGAIAHFRLGIQKLFKKFGK